MKNTDSVLCGINYVKDEPMSKHTTFRIGGCADYFICPENTEELKLVLSLDMPKIIIGNGSNMLFPDEGFRGAVVKYSDVSMNCEGESIICGSGVLLSKLAFFAYEHSLSGLEFASGIPGSLGGGVRMNAGAYGGSLESVICETEFVDGDSLSLKRIEGSQHCFSYRHSFFTDNPNFVITKVKLDLKKGDKAEIKAITDDFTVRRTTKQPLKYPSAGSVFKRPEGYFAGALIEECGLKGYSVGDAEVSELHAGFIINKGGATAEDVKKLISYIQETVYKRFGVNLECEVCIL